MSRADIIATPNVVGGRLLVLRDEAANAFDRAHGRHFTTGTGETYRALEAARTARREAQDAVDAHDKTEAAS